MKEIFIYDYIYYTMFMLLLFVIIFLIILIINDKYIFLHDRTFLK